MLTHALTTLDTLQRTQQALFRKTVSHLCSSISSAAVPPAPRTAKQKLGSKLKMGQVGSGDGHSDLYAWREVFTLWIEAEIFESSAERNRGERGIEEAERRLKAFAGEVTRRGLGDRRTLKSRESRAALNTFLQLNLTLLDLKKFQTANIKAARKILKKHDKRTSTPVQTWLSLACRLGLTCRLFSLCRNRSHRLFRLPTIRYLIALDADERGPQQHQDVDVV